MKRQFLGYQLDLSERSECVAELSTLIQSARKTTLKASTKWLACLNPHSYAVALDDLEFARALDKANWLIPDGIGVVLAGRVLGLDIRERVTGYDIFIGLLRDLHNSGGGRIFLLGSTDEVLAKIAVRFKQDFPLVEVSGSYSPPFMPVFSEAENQKIASLINASNSDILFVSLSAPKQEKWIAMMQPRLNVPFIAAIGAVFDFYTGNIRRSPLIFQSIGLEWLPRLLQEPSRLWRRMLISAPRFIFHVMHEWLMQRWN